MIEHLNAARRAPFSARTERAQLNVCLINPRFEPAFFSFDYVLPMLDGNKRHWMTPGALPMVAALAPAGVSVEILDENVRTIDFDDLRRFDIIGVTGMIVQRKRMFEILEGVRDLPAVVVVGGPYISIAEADFINRCDVRFVGEADETWPDFLRALLAGNPVAERYEQAAKTDVTTLPVPRYDLLEMPRYMSAAVQFSRGCPFQCEFCDIITIYGRRPRVKTTEQIIAEVDAVHRAGAGLCFMVDDNFIGNKKAAKQMLPALIEWQRAHGYPLQFTTEASVNLADDPELMELMVQANFRSVFMGLESPRAESLQETRKFQNTAGDSLLQKVARVRDAGLVVSAGFIVGFDSDDAAIFGEQYRFIQESGIGQASLTILSPLPTTPLYDRLAAAGRLDYSDPEVAFTPAQMTQRELREGHTDLLRRLYNPGVYLDRILLGYRSSPAFRTRRAQLAAQSRKLGARIRVLRTLGALRIAARLTRMLFRRRKFALFAPAIAGFYFKNLAMGRDAMPFFECVALVLTSWHFYNMAYSPQKMLVGNPMLEARAAQAELAV